VIYLDVTSAAGSSTNGGVQRAIRGIYRHLRSGGAVRPVRWDFSSRRYARLSPRENNLLTDPFGSHTKPAGIPGLLNGPTSTGALSDHWTRRARGLPLATVPGPGDVLLIADLCWDARIYSWSKLAQLPGRKIAIFHDAMPLRIPGQASSKDELYAQYVQKLAQLDLVICISQEVERDLLRFWRDFGVTAKPTVVLPWPMPFAGERPDNRPNLAAKRIIYVSRLRLRKNHLILLEACERLWREGMTFSLDLVGMACAFIDTVKILIRVAELRRRGRPLRWLKHVSETELGRAYQECSFTVFPSQMEGFGFPIIESLWHLRPVICGRNGAIGEIAAGGGCRQIDQNNVVELADAIRQLLTDQSAYDRLCAEAAARTFRTWDDYGSDLEAVLEPAAAR
jgi:glycosyltransferase involved in cell wall biosynthesis